MRHQHRVSRLLRRQVSSRILLTGILLISLPLTAAAAESGVRDGGGLFNLDAVTQANRLAAEIKESSGRDVVVETFGTIPQNLRQRFEGGNRDTFYRDWALDRARSLGVNGIYIQIVGDPGHLEIAVGQRTGQRDFTSADRDRVRDTMLSSLRQRDFDTALLTGLQQIRSALARNQAGSGTLGGGAAGGGGAAVPPVGQTTPRGTPGPVETARKPFSGSFLCMALGVGAVVLLVMAFRKLKRGLTPAARQSGAGMGGLGSLPGFGGQSGGYGGQSGYGKTGGGLGRGVMGGLLGGLLGNWVQKRMGGGRQNDPGERGGSGGRSDIYGGGGVGGGSTSGGDFGPPSGGGTSGGDFGNFGDEDDRSGGDF